MNPPAPQQLQSNLQIFIWAISLQLAKHENQLISSKILAIQRKGKRQQRHPKKNEIIGKPKPDPQQDKQLGEQKKNRNENKAREWKKKEI